MFLFVGQPASDGCRASTNKLKPRFISSSASFCVLNNLFLIFRNSGWRTSLNQHLCSNYMHKRSTLYPGKTALSCFCNSSSQRIIPPLGPRNVLCVISCDEMSLPTGMQTCSNQSSYMSHVNHQICQPRQQFSELVKIYCS